MKLLVDCFGRHVRLADERLAHILDHAEMAGMAVEVERVLREPQLVRRSRSDEAVRLFYEFYAQTLVGGKGCGWWLNIQKRTPSSSLPTSPTNQKLEKIYGQ